MKRSHGTHDIADQVIVYSSMQGSSIILCHSFNVKYYCFSILDCSMRTWRFVVVSFLTDSNIQGGLLLFLSIQIITAFILQWRLHVARKRLTEIPVEYQAFLDSLTSGILRFDASTYSLV